MVKIALVTDSTADIPLNILSEKTIHCVPLKVHFGEEVYKDSVDMMPQEFYTRLRKETAIIPKSSQPAPTDFVELYEKLLEEYDYIVSVHISAPLSGTVQSAFMARDEYMKAEQKEKIFIYDSGVVSCALGIIVLQIDDAIKSGASIEGVLKAAEWTIENARLLTALDTMLYLEKNGRVGKATAFLGGLLSLKPILTIKEGGLVGADRIRGTNKVLPRMVELMHEIGPKNDSGIRCMVAHGDDIENGNTYAKTVSNEFGCADVPVTFCGPVVGCHGGPKVMVIGWVPVYPKELIQ